MRISKTQFSLILTLMLNSLPLHIYFVMTNRQHFGQGKFGTLDSRRSSGDGASGETNGKLIVSFVIFTFFPNVMTKMLEMFA